MFLCRDELWQNLYEQRGIRYILNLADAERAMSKHTYPVPENLIENIPYDKVGSFLLPRLAFFIPLAFVLLSTHFSKTLSEPTSWKILQEAVLSRVQDDPEDDKVLFRLGVSGKLFFDVCRLLAVRDSFINEWMN